MLLIKQLTHGGLCIDAIFPVESTLRFVDVKNSVNVFEPGNPALHESKPSNVFAHDAEVFSRLSSWSSSKCESGQHLKCD